MSKSNLKEQRKNLVLSIAGRLYAVILKNRNATAITTQGAREVTEIASRLYQASKPYFKSKKSGRGDINDKN